MRAKITVNGSVQGVGFRWWVKLQADALGLVGYAENLYDGRVEVWAQGERGAVVDLVHRLIEQPSDHGRPGRVTSHELEYGDERAGLRRFNPY